MLTDNDIKEELSYAYIHAVAAECGYACERIQKDRDSVDVVIRGKFIDSINEFPELKLQLKATSVRAATGETFSFPLKQKNFNDLTKARTTTPRLLVVLILPDDRTHWLSSDTENLILRRCVFWHNLQGRPQITAKQMTIKVSTRNVFTPDSLRKMMARIAKDEEIGHAIP